MFRFSIGLSASLFLWVPLAVAHAQENRTLVPHVRNTEVFSVELAPGQVLEASTCSEHGGSAQGDTVLVLLGPDGSRRQNDDACGSLASHLVFPVPQGGGGQYRLRAQCFGAGRCGGEVAVWTRARRRGEIAEASSRGLRDEPWARIQTLAELVVPVNRAGAGGLFEARLDARPVSMIGLHLRMSPVGLVGGEGGGVLSGSLRGFVTYDLVDLAIGLGGGVSTLSSRLTDSPNMAEPLLGLYFRLGNLEYGYFEAQYLLGVSVFEPMALDVEGRIPSGEVELLLRGRVGFDGALQAHAGVLFWLPGSTRRELGIFALVGAAGLFYQPVCRFDVPCVDTLWYAGPTIGTGLEWRP